MKTKLTLTVRKSVVEAARQYSRKTGKSISAMFEEMFDNKEPNTLKSENQRAAERLLKTLSQAKHIKTTSNDKRLIRKYVAGKFA